MERVKAALRVKHYSFRTEKTYCYWIRFFIRFHKMRHPANMAGNEVRQFLRTWIHRITAALWITP
ncbi:phage integrase N-terminal SAM-like domain-containing protein [Vreelandella arcis]|uniref:phage integrase N-terminal SAM-like domain-containing protein n=1 Tax=Vreelandella arcis TaxID=416873 RepID=UPI001FCCD5D9|nr:phage integrase N-terminal SAM-like domain-containing protein [Halomonas arcis]